MFQVLDWAYLIKPTMMTVDGISFPRAYLYTKVDDHVCLQYREQMCDIDGNGRSVLWKPISGPVRILHDIDLDNSRQRLVPKKPIPLDGLQRVIERLTKFKKLDVDSVRVRLSEFSSVFLTVCCLGMEDLF